MIDTAARTEEARLTALHRYEIMDTPAEVEFDDLTLLAAQICHTPVAVISLVDAQRQWFKSTVGMELHQTTRVNSFCAETILREGPLMEIPDARADRRFADLPLVTGVESIRFYAGAKLISGDGHALGTLCVMDRTPRHLNLEQTSALEALGRRVVGQLEARRNVRELMREIAARRLAEEALASELRKLAANEQAAKDLLLSADRSRRTLLSVLEDEKRSVHDLRESEERFRQLAESVREVFWMTDRKNDTILYISPNYEKIWGRSCRSLRECPAQWLESIHPEDRPRVAQAAGLRESTAEFAEVYRIIRPDGSQRWIQDRAFPVRNAAGEVYRFVGTAEDITEQKLLQSQLLRTQRLEAVGTLASGIAHDLNNILAPIMMVSSLLREKLPDPADAELLGMMEKGAERGANIIKQLLTFGRGVEGERGLVQIKHLAKEMLVLMRETFPREIVIADDIAGEVPPVIGDATQLSQILMNLCVNARDAMRGGGRLTLSARLRTLTVEQVPPHSLLKPGPHLLLAVTDTGTGIPKESLDRIFEPFYTTKGVGEGTGLGLSTVLGIVKSHGGFVTVESELGRGSTFQVYLPAATMESPPVVSVSGQREHGRSRLVLIVDDEEAIRKTVAHTLRSRGFRVLAACDGRAGLKLYQAHRLEDCLVITDDMMPVMGGIAMIRAIRAIDPRQPILVMSGLIEIEKADELRELGIQSLAKPCDTEALLAMVHGTARFA